MRVGVWVLVVSLLSMFFVCFFEVVNESFVSCAGSCCDRFSGLCCKFVYQLSSVMRCM